MLTTVKLCLRACLCVFGAQVAVSQALQNSIALTVASGQTEIGSFELTIPAMVKTMTEVSMVTITQISVQQSTVSVLTTVSGLCVAPSPSTLATSSTPQASDQAASSSLASLQNLASLPSVVVVVEGLTPSNTSTASIDTSSTATPSAGVQLLNASPEQCQCQCLCPASAFPAYGSMAAPPAIPMSTFQTITSLVTAGQPSPSLVISAFSSSVTAPSSPPSISSPSTASNSELPQDSSVSKNTNSLMDAITVALNLRGLKPTSILN